MGIKTKKHTGAVKFKLIPKNELAGHAAFHFLCTQVTVTPHFSAAFVTRDSRNVHWQINWTRQVLKLASAVVRYQQLSLVNSNTAKRRRTLEGIHVLIRELASNSYDQITRS